MRTERPEADEREKISDTAAPVALRMEAPDAIVQTRDELAALECRTARDVPRGAGGTRPAEPSTADAA